MDAKSAGDLMIPLETYPNIPGWFTLRQAVEKIENSVIEVEGRKSLPRALLVIDKKNRLLGIVRRRDILRMLKPKFLQSVSFSHQKKLFDIEIDPGLADISFTEDKKIIQEQAEQLVSKVMRPIDTTVNYNDQLGKIIFLMISKDLNLLPVLRDQKVVGVVRSVDVFHEVAKLLM
jgi:predicted transcriptional regulator